MSDPPSAKPTLAQALEQRTRLLKSQRLITAAEARLQGNPITIGADGDMLLAIWGRLRIALVLPRECGDEQLEHIAEAFVLVQTLCLRSDP